MTSQDYLNKLLELEEAIDHASILAEKKDTSKKAVEIYTKLQRVKREIDAEPNLNPIVLARFNGLATKLLHQGFGV